MPTRRFMVEASKSGVSIIPESYAESYNFLHTSRLLKFMSQINDAHLGITEGLSVWPRKCASGALRITLNNFSGGSRLWGAWTPRPINAAEL
jgi:hypothetical protein